MTTRSTTHATFVIERVLPAPLVRAFDAFANPASKQSWFACHEDMKTVAYELDFRVGGRELNVVAVPNGPHHRFEAFYLDIVPEHRIIYAYAMYVDERRISASLATHVFSAAGRRTKLTFTEQAVFLDGYEGDPDRRQGTELGFDALERWLQEPTSERR